MITYNDVITAAFEELIISGLTSKPSPEENSMAIRRLQAMALSWENKGICLSFIPQESLSNLNPNQDTGLNDTSFFAVYLNLAKTLAAGFGRSLSRETLAEAKNAYDGLFSVKLTQREPSPYQPTGSGQSFGYRYRSDFNFQAEEFNAPDNCLTADIKVGETDSYPVNFNQFLNEVSGETIVSYTVDQSDGVSIIDSISENGYIILNAYGASVGFAPIKITVVTESRTNPETINFNVTAT